MSERIATKCPACHNSTLVIGGGNWLVCSLIGCPDPTRINSVGDRADSHFDDLQTLRDERDRLRANLINCSERLAAYYGDNYPAVVDARAALMPAGGGKNDETSINNSRER